MKEQMSRQTKQQIDLLVKLAHSQVYYLKKIVHAMVNAGDKEALKKLADELAGGTDELEATIKANTPT